MIAAADLATLKARLEARLHDLGQEVEKLEREATQSLDADFEEQAKQIEDIDTAEGLEAVRVDEGRDIRAALQRIADGNYGVCANCGTDIAPARLNALPMATLCIDCAP